MMSVKQKQRLIEVVPYDFNWPLQFEQEAKKIKKALGNNCIEIHHIGSTSVPDLAAKPIIDMIPVVLELDKVDSANAAMQALGYEAKGEYGILFRRYFQKGDNLRTHHAHIFELGNPEIERHLKFRNWMRAHPDDRKAYAHLKKELAHQYPYDITAYCLGKENFITAIDKKAGFNGLRMVKALTAREWNKVRHFRQFYFLTKQGFLTLTPGLLSMMLMFILSYFKEVATSLVMPICNYGHTKEPLCVSLLLMRQKETIDTVAGFWHYVNSGSKAKGIIVCTSSHHQMH
ncbi:hypothetical protein Loa_00263 [Legionella oakridgensis ATCC 33761 = DSM 21215]|uniref:Glutamate rich protein GrpB n=1 Tax=Legionella oakridgensis ATCC 33761 = DSM 21215 TaxID=1268635 RepID=W0BB67_9GAMM|nr:hypothetical protein Loa_00263 [Legionella oakridgensis ATCC 33761 = DSM 21215]